MKNCLSLEIGWNGMITFTWEAAKTMQLRKDLENNSELKSILVMFGVSSY